MAIEHATSAAELNKRSQGKRQRVNYAEDEHSDPCDYLDPDSDQQHTDSPVKQSIQPEHTYESLETTGSPTKTDHSESPIKTDETKPETPDQPFSDASAIQKQPPAPPHVEIPTPEKAPSTKIAKL